MESKINILESQDSTISIAYAEIESMGEAACNLLARTISCWSPPDALYFRDTHSAIRLSTLLLRRWAQEQMEILGRGEAHERWFQLDSSIAKALSARSSPREMAGAVKAELIGEEDMSLEDVDGLTVVILRRAFRMDLEHGPVGGLIRNRVQICEEKRTFLEVTPSMAEPTPDGLWRPE